MQTLERTKFGVLHTAFVWLVGGVSWWVIIQLAGGGLFVFLTKRSSLRTTLAFIEDQLTGRKALLAACFVLMVVLCAFLRSRWSRGPSRFAEESLVLASVLIFPTEVATVVMGLAAALSHLGLRTDRKLREREFSPWFVDLGEILYRGGMTAVLTLAGSTVYRLLYSPEWTPLTGIGPREIAALIPTYGTIAALNAACSFLLEWVCGLSVFEYIRGMLQLRSLTAFLTEISTVLLGLAIAVTSGTQGIPVFLILGTAFVSTVALIGKQEQIAHELQTTVVELKILTGVGKALTNSTQTRKELLKAMYEKGGDLFGAESLAIYMFPESGSQSAALALEKTMAAHPGRPSRKRLDAESSSTSESFESLSPEERATGLAEWCLRHQRLVRIDDLDRDASRYGYRWMTKTLPFRSWLGIPLVTARRPLGVLSVASTERSAFTVQHEEMLQALGQQFVGALENARLFELATIDGLTGLLSPRYLRQRLAEEFEKARKTDSPLGLLMIDVDFFKKVNDTHGHEIGNVVLARMASLIRENLRDSDIAARYGGEEFTVLLPGTSSLATGEVAERLRRLTASTPIDIPGGTLSVTVSIGLVHFPTLPAGTHEHLLEAADKALYQSKQNGRNRVTVAR